MFKHFLNADTDVEEKLDEDKRTNAFFEGLISIKNQGVL